MSNGLWSVVFSAHQDVGAGVVTIIDGKVLGGDSGFSYVGSFLSDGSESISGELAISRHSRFLQSVLPGLDNYSLLITGAINQNQLELVGKVKGKENLQLRIKGKKISGL